MNSPKLTAIVISYNMVRELPRTILSLSPVMQRDISSEDYEIIIVDNGSTETFIQDQFLKLDKNISFHRITNPTPSPVPAINYGLSLARGDLVGVIIDGSRIASPRLLATALEAAQIHHRPVIGTLAFHLGPDLQKNSIINGYCQDVEDRLLDTIDWVADGYRLFDIAVFASSSANGWFVIPTETNALFLKREHWQELGGYDPAFISPGGGLSNHDTWSRACADPAGRVIVLLGEATFHQVHGGIATNSMASQWPLFHEEYMRLRGREYTPPTGAPLLVGCLHSTLLGSIKSSAERLQQIRNKDNLL
jgi:glycosyltransferase involved in cell wall biosynthesis